MSVDVQFLSFRPMLGYGTTQIRCQQPAEFLRAMGWSVATGMVLSAPAARCRLLVLHRVRNDALTKQIVALAKSRGSYVIYDIDDLVGETKDGETFAPDIAEAMLSCDMVTVSSSYLADKVSQINGNCKIIRNKLAASVLDAGARATAANCREQSDVNLGYFSGSAHHDADFDHISPDIIALMQAYPNVRLTVGGKINVSREFERFGDRFRLEPFRPYTEFIGLLKGIDINLAPLDLRSPIACARSELKFLEASAFAVPTIASPNLAFSEAIRQGITGFLATSGNWFDVMEKLVCDAELRRTVGSAAQKFVENEYGPKAGQNEWDELLRSHAGQFDAIQNRSPSDCFQTFSVVGRARLQSARKSLRVWVSRR